MVAVPPSWWTCGSINKSTRKSNLNVKANRCSSLALFVLTMETMEEQYPSVSQSLNIVYHSPAAL